MTGETIEKRNKNNLEIWFSLSGLLQFHTEAHASLQPGSRLSAGVGLMWHWCGKEFLAVLFLYLYFFLCSCWCEPKVCLCFHAVWACVLGLLQCCLPGFVVCWWCLFLSLFTLLFLSSLLSPHPVHQTLPAYLMLGCWYIGLAPPQLSPSTLPPFSTPPAPSPANGPPSPKFGRDPLSYCLKEINKTVKPRISSFRTLRRSVSHQRKRFGWQETSSHQGLHIIMSLLQERRSGFLR